MTAAGDKLIRFCCDCGVLLKARASQSGRKGRCKECGRINIIPSFVEAEAVEDAGEAVAVEEVCGICQSVIEEDDERTLCSRCDLPFHAECWQENLGCSAYGCANVNALKQGPDIRVDAARGPYPPARKPAHPAAVAPPAADEGFPWDYAIMGAAGLAVLLGVCTCGVPPLVMGVAAVVYAVLRQGKSRLAPLVGSVVVAVLGGLMGFLLSLLYWLV